MLEFAGKTAFITGAANGIGRGIAASLAAAGAKIAIADIDAQTLEATRADFEAEGATVLAIPLDVSDRAAVERAADRIEAELGPVHVLVNNA